MHVVIIFHNLGGYHIARLKAAQALLAEKNITLTAIQETASATEHPWGNVNQKITFPLITLIPAAELNQLGDLSPQSPIAAQRLPTYLSKIKPDIVVIPGWGFPIARTALSWTTRHQIPAILMSDSKWDDEPRQWWKEKIKSLLYVNKFQAALVAGNSHKDYLVRLGMARESIFLGYDVVDNDYFSQQTQKARQHLASNQPTENSPPSVPYFITVSRFIPRKNLLLLLNAYLKYYQEQQSQGWKLVICGSGIQENTIKQFIQTHSLNSVVHLPGFVSYQDIPQWYAGAKALIHPALQEQWGLVVNEAMAAGLPVLVSNRCGCFEDLVIEDINGFGFDPENQYQLTHLMLKMSSGEINLERMGQASLKQIQKYSPEYFAQGLMQATEYALRPH